MSLKRGVHLAYEYIGGTQTMLTADWVKLKANSIDHIRLPFKPSTLFTNTSYNTFVTAEKNRLDALLNTALSYNLSVILDAHDTDPTAIANGYTGLTAIWQTVSNAYKTQPVDNGTPTGFGVYYEIFNEPQESDSGVWTSKHNAAITALRAIDTSGRKVIVNGMYGADPNGFDPVSPLTDTNVIYAFHFYEPFTFTHCGASWVNLSGVANVSYPTDPDQVDYKLIKISNNGQGPERKAAYNKENFLSHILDHPLAWAKQHNVPMMCTEGGVYADFTQTEDANNWYSDYISSLSELNLGYTLFCYGTTIFPISDTVLGMVKADAAAKNNGIQTANGKKSNAKDEGNNLFTQFTRLFSGKREVSTRNPLPVVPIIDSKQVGPGSPMPTCGGSTAYNQFNYGIAAGNTAAVSLMDKNPYRKSLTIQNQSSTASIWLRFSDTASATPDGYSYKLAPGKSWPEGPVGMYPNTVVSAISDMVGISTGYHFIQIIEA